MILDRKEQIHQTPDPVTEEKQQKSKKFLTFDNPS